MQHGTAIKPAILTEVQYKAKYGVKYYTEDLEQFLWVSKRVHGTYRKSEWQCKKPRINKKDVKAWDTLQDIFFVFYFFFVEEKKNQIFTLYSSMFLKKE